MRRLFHVSSSLNRASIQRHGLDWSRMRLAPGISGSSRPEIDGVFLCRDEGEVDFFVRLNNTGGPVDVWALDGVDEAELLESPEGFAYLPAVVAPQRLSLLPGRREPSPVGHTSSGAYQSRLTITLDDGTVLRDNAAHEWLRLRHADDRL